MVVDEAQDFKPPSWPALLSMHSDPDHGRLLIFADDNQNLCRGELPEWIPRLSSNRPRGTVAR